MDPIMAFARQHGLFVVEDACQAHGAEYNGRRAGSIGDAGCFSFYPGKNLGAFGEAGAVVTDNAELMEKVRVLRDHGQIHKYHHSMVGWNCRMDGIQGAVLQVKLRHLEAGNELRRAHALQYNAAFEGERGVSTPFKADYAQHVYHIYALRVQDRNQVIRLLTEKGIGSGIHYPVPLHLQTAYRSLGYGPNDFPVSERVCSEFVSLPIYPELTSEQIKLVIETVKEIISNNRGVRPANQKPANIATSLA
jgi:dTDP-4-amino-4,6-dideoxygalactose transaminase